MKEDLNKWQLIDIYNSTGDSIRVTKKQIEEIVKYWYLSGLEPDIFQNEDGQDLEAVLTSQSTLRFKEVVIFKEAKLKF